MTVLGGILTAWPKPDAPDFAFADPEVPTVQAKSAQARAPAVQTSHRQECLYHISMAKKVAVHVQDRGDFF
jgi:hypothetical protein